LSDLEINKGVELLLRRRKPEPKPTFQVGFDRSIAAFRRHVTVKFGFSIDIKRKIQ
jgi:hypothetical protein|tara:strand:- start:373 stop:540 length:168 start_codon:yes stop_codon:yes gene_type:complete